MNQKLYKVITDGDIRRSLLKGDKMGTLAKDIHSRNPVIAKENQPLEEVKYFSKRIEIIQ